MTGPWIICIIAAYLVGSIPFGFIIARMRGVDIRQHGSGNIGATNVMRVLGKKAGIMCFALDMAKGALPVLVAGVWNDVFGRRAVELSAEQMWLWLAVAAAAVIGHMFSIVLRGRGGKGVATAFGAMVAMYPLLTLPALGSLIVWYASVRVFKIVSLASMIAVVSLPLGYVLASIPPDALDQPLSHTMDHLRHGLPPLVVTSVIAVLVVFQHRSNIARIMQGTEPKAKR